MIQLKACPRCSGDIKLNRDIYGNYAECLQCGFMRDIVDPVPIVRDATLYNRQERKAV